VVGRAAVESNRVMPLLTDSEGRSLWEVMAEADNATPE